MIPKRNDKQQKYGKILLNSEKNKVSELSKLPKKSLPNDSKRNDTRQKLKTKKAKQTAKKLKE